MYNARDEQGNITQYMMDAWLKLLGIWYADGYTMARNGKRGNMIGISAHKQRKKNFHIQLLTELGVEYRMDSECTVISGTRYPAIYNELSPLSVGAINKSLPNYVWKLSQRQSRILLNAIIEGDGSYNKNGSAGYYTSSIKLANDVARLALHCCWSGSMKKRGDIGDPYVFYKNGTIDHQGTTNANSYYIKINKTKTEPQINHGHVHQQNAQEEKYEHYKGPVWCLEIPDTHQHIYYYRMNEYSSPHWSGNSSRSGLTNCLSWPEVASNSRLVIWAQ
jgi:hypothetical protein